MIRQAGSKTLISGVAIYLITNIFNAAIPFALLPILTRYLTPSEYGQVAIFQTFLGAIGAFVGLNAAGATTRKYYDTTINTKGMKEFIAACLQILLGSTLIVLLLVYFLQVHLSEWLKIDSKWMFAAILLSFMNVVINIRLIQWQVKKQAYHYGAFQVLQSIANMCLSIILVVVFLQGGEGRIKAQIFSAAILFVISLALLKHDKLLAIFTWQPSNIQEGLRFGIPFIPHVTGAFLLASVDRFVINAELGLEKAGIYMVAVQISLALSLIFDSVNKAYVPWLFELLKKNIEEEKKKIVRYTYTWYLCIFFGVIIVFFTGPWIINLIADERYSEAGKIIGWLALSQGFRGMYLMTTNYIFYAKRTGFLSMSTVSSGLINVALLFNFIPIMGIKGAAIASTITMGILFFSTWIIAQRLHPMPWFRFK